MVVTGAGSGLGRALALALRNKGSRVAAVGLNENTLMETLDHTVVISELLGLFGAIR